MAWAEFYVYMMKLDRPVENEDVSVISLGELADKYGTWMKWEVEFGRMKPRTLAYYRDHIQRFLDVVVGRRLAVGVKPFEVEMFKTGCHSVQALQRLFNWSVKLGYLKENPMKSVAKPELGQRERILSRKEMMWLLRGAEPEFRAFLLAMRHTVAKASRDPRSSMETFRLGTCADVRLGRFQGEKTTQR